MVFDRETGVRHDAIEQAFERANVDARTFFHPLSSLGLFEESRKRRSPTIWRRDRLICQAMARWIVLR